jgi:hypothetical protein
MQNSVNKHLIEFGWDEPDTAFMKSHIAEMEKTPFDGTVFHLLYTKPDGTRGRFMNECWSKRAFTETELQHATDELKATKFTRFQHNFLRFNVCPGDVDWFDDAGFAAVANNARLAAQIAREGNARGVLFDIEQYNTHLWDFTKRTQHDKDWTAYAKQVRLRGREIMTALRSGFGDEVIVFLTFGYSLPYSETASDASKLPTVSYGLLAPFLNGMSDAAGDGARIIDGFEISYGYKTREQFAQGREIMQTGVLPLVADATRYHEVFEKSFGLWLDFDWRKHGWNTTDVSKNYFTPESFAEPLKHALEQSDEYVWIYTEKPKWWSESGGPVDLPEAYEHEIRRARE